MLNRLLGGARSEGPSVRVLDVAEVRRALDAGKVVLVDVREPDEFAAERIPGSILMPLSGFDPARMPEIPDGKMLVLHCRSGQRCGMAAERLVAAGWTGEINRLAGGIIGWRAAGGPVAPGR